MFFEKFIPTKSKKAVCGKRPNRLNNKHVFYIANLVICLVL